jgi:glycosyltransferase involved in cell wall biosynthesis
MTDPGRTRNIAFLLNRLTVGGTERISLTMAHALQARGCQVTLLLMAGVGQLLSSVNDGITVHDFGKKRVIECLPGLWRYLRTKRPEVLFTALPTVNIAGIVANLFAGRKTAIMPVEHMPVGIDSTQNPRLEPRIAYSLYPWFYGFADRIITIGEDARADFLRTFPTVDPNKIELIYNGVVDDELFSAGREEPELAWLREQPRSVPIVVTVGRLSPEKNFQLLVRAFALLRKELPCRLIIMGTGTEHSKLQALINELGLSSEVLLSGYVKNLYACLTRADLFVLSSRYETLPTVVIEALACGTPVVATPCTGVREILAGGRFGTILAGTEPETMAAAMLQSLHGKTDRQALIARGQEFSVERAAKQYLALIDTVLAERAAS